MKKLLFCLLFITIGLYAQQNSMSGYYIRGTIKNQITQEPLKKTLVRVFLNQIPLEAALTNESGEFKIGICSCFDDSLLTITIEHEAYLPVQETFIPSTKKQFSYTLTYDYKNGISTTGFKESYNKAFYKRSLPVNLAQRFYINCLGEIKQGHELKRYSEQNWELTTIGNLGH